MTTVPGDDTHFSFTSTRAADQLAPSVAREDAADGVTQSGLLSPGDASGSLQSSTVVEYETFAAAPARSTVLDTSPRLSLASTASAPAFTFPGSFCAPIRWMSAGDTLKCSNFGLSSASYTTRFKDTARLESGSCTRTMLAADVPSLQTYSVGVNQCIVSPGNEWTNIIWEEALVTNETTVQQNTETAWCETDVAPGAQVLASIIVSNYTGGETTAQGICRLGRTLRAQCTRNVVSHAHSDIASAAPARPSIAPALWSSAREDVLRVAGLFEQRTVDSTMNVADAKPTVACKAGLPSASQTPPLAVPSDAAATFTTYLLPDSATVSAWEQSPAHRRAPSELSRTTSPIDVRAARSGQGEHHSSSAVDLRTLSPGDAPGTPSLRLASSRMTPDAPGSLPAPSTASPARSNTVAVPSSTPSRASSPSASQLHNIHLVLFLPYQWTAQTLPPGGRFADGSLACQQMEAAAIGTVRSAMREPRCASSRACCAPGARMPLDCMGSTMAILRGRADTVPAVSAVPSSAHEPLPVLPLSLTVVCASFMSAYDLGGMPVVPQGGRTYLTISLVYSSRSSSSLSPGDMAFDRHFSVNVTSVAGYLLSIYFSFDSRIRDRQLKTTSHRLCNCTLSSTLLGPATLLVLFAPRSDCAGSCCVSTNDTSREVEVEPQFRTDPKPRWPLSSILQSLPFSYSPARSPSSSDLARLTDIPKTCGFYGFVGQRHIASFEASQLSPGVAGTSTTMLRAVSLLLLHAFSVRDLHASKQIPHKACNDMERGFKFFSQLRKNPGRRRSGNASIFVDILITAITLIVVAVSDGPPLAVTLALALAVKRITEPPSTEREHEDDGFLLNQSELNTSISPALDLLFNEAICVNSTAFGDKNKDSNEDTNEIESVGSKSEDALLWFAQTLEWEDYRTAREARTPESPMRGPIPRTTSSMVPNFRLRRPVSMVPGPRTHLSGGFVWSQWPGHMLPSVPSGRRFAPEQCFRAPGRPK
ncbi:hypothetical protein EXIGLDRAFT_70597 [Exidia glandulosa HHB12029]|uniref:Uncharacterized protein n=1 Tax=Exidia glandulosa HHB12029 TaxID=1314781 RepID=A0A165HXH9_EXIGL|nr:hypothetical protein EXIGLDRAFT_70597 [Exidia glandulosa HHB12029]